MAQQKKYEFVPGDEKVIAPGRTVKRIRALIAIAALGVAPGELGGYIESESNLQVSGNAQVYGNALVESQTDWLLVGPAKSSGHFTTAYRDTKIVVRVSRGCFTGTAQEFSAQIEATHEGNQQHLQQYRLFFQLIAVNFDTQPA